MVWKNKSAQFCSFTIENEENNLLFQVHLFHLYLLQITQIEGHILQRL